MRFKPLALLLAALAVSACSGAGSVTDGPDAPPTDPEPTYPAYETFDPTGYDAEAPPADTDVTIVHDVPASVMAGRVVVPGAAAPPEPEPDPGPRQVEGYRVQIYASESRQNAERVRSEALRWWSQAGTGEPLDVVVAYLQPYYRVRVGAFERREEADAALAQVRRQYPEAFIVPDTVTVGG